MTQTKIPRFVTGIQRRRVNSGSSQVDRIQCLHALFAPLLSSKRTRNIISFRIGEKRSSNFARILRAKNIDRRYFSKAEGRRGFQFERAVPRNLVPRRRNFGIGIRKFFSRCSPCINLPLSLHFSPVLALPSPTLVHRFNPPLPGSWDPLPSSSLYNTSPVNVDPLCWNPRYERIREITREKKRARYSDLRSIFADWIFRSSIVVDMAVPWIFERDAFRFHPSFDVFFFFFLFCFAPRERFFVSFGGREFGEWKKFCGSRKWKVVFLRACVLSFCINFVSGFFIHFYFKIWIYMYIYIVRPHQWINASDCRRELRIEFVFFFLSKSSNYIHLGSMRVDKSTASSNYKSRKLLQGLKFSSPKNVKLRTWPGNSDKDRSLSISSLRSRI